MTDDTLTLNTPTTHSHSLELRARLSHKPPGAGSAAVHPARFSAATVVLQRPAHKESSPAHVRRVRAPLLPGGSWIAAGTYTSRVRIHSHEYASRALGPSSSAVGRRAASPAGESLAQCHNVASSTAPEAAATSTGFDRDSQRRSLLCAPSSGASSPRCSGSSALVPAIRTRCVRGTCQGAAAPCSPLRYRKSVVVIRRKRWAALLCVSVFSTVGRC